MNHQQSYDRSVMKFSTSSSLRFDTPRSKSTKLHQSSNKQNLPKTHLSRALMLLRFFTFHWDKVCVASPTVIYAGAAPGYHVREIARLFPLFTFHLYDKKPFLIPSSKNIIIHKEELSDLEVELWKDNDDIYFISEICVNESSRSMQLQKKWYETLNPHQALLVIDVASPTIYNSSKPYTLFDEIENSKSGKSGRFKYLDGVIYYRSFSSTKSTLLELVPNTLERVYYSSDCMNGLEYFRNVTNQMTFDVLPYNQCGGYDSTTLYYLAYHYVTKYSRYGMSKDKRRPVDSAIRLCRTLLFNLSRHK